MLSGTLASWSVPSRCPGARSVPARVRSGIGVGLGLVATAANTQAVLVSVLKWTTGGAFPNFAASDDYAHLRR